MPLSPMFTPFVSLILAMPIVAGQNGVQQAGEADVISTSTDRHDRLTVPVRIGSHGPFQFMIDTGSQNTVLSTGVASTLGIPIGNRVKLTGVAGSELVDTVEVEQIDLGKRSYYGVLAPLLERADIGADGIIGLDSLQGQRVQIDFRKGVMAVADAKSLGGNKGYEIVVTARRRSGQLIMTDAVIDGVRVQVVIDTGSDTSIGNRALQRQLAKRGMHGQTTLRSVTGQTIVADIGFARRLKIDQVNFGNVLIAYADSPHFAVLGLDAKPALFLGMRDLRQLDRIAIDFATRRIYFDIPVSSIDSSGRYSDDLGSRLD
ncbi:MAG: aspartyl protease family protein [Sphingomonadales bacterium]|nr:aspartyl protease family protein [Sphingomonadales bacterium]